MRTPSATTIPTTTDHSESQRQKLTIIRIRALIRARASRRARIPNPTTLRIVCGSRATRPRGRRRRGSGARLRRRRRTRPTTTRRALQRQQARLVRQTIIVAAGPRPALVQQLQVARVDGEGLVGAGADEVAVGDVGRPARAAVGLAREGGALARRLRRPGPRQAAGGVGAEVAAVGADRLDEHEVLGGALPGHGVHLHGLEDVVGSAAEDDGGGCAEVAREVTNGHACAVDLAVVAREEEVHVGAVADDGLVDHAGAGVRDGAGEERLRGRPAVGIRRVARGAVGEACWAPLVREDPRLLGGEVEEGGCDGARGHGILAGRGHAGPVREEAEGHGAPARPVRRPVHEVLAIVGDVGEVLERDPARLGGCQGAARGPLVSRRETARGLRRRERRREQCGGGGDLHGDFLLFTRPMGSMGALEKQRKGTKGN